MSASQLAGPYELYLTLGTLVPLAMVAAAPLAVGGWLITAGLGAPDTRRGKISVALPATLLALGVGVGVSGGRMLAGARRPVFVAALVVAAQNFDADVITYLMVIAVIGLVVLMPAAGELGKRSPKAPEEAEDVPPGEEMPEEASEEQK